MLATRQPPRARRKGSGNRHEEDGGPENRASEKKSKQRRTSRSRKAKKGREGKERKAQRTEHRAKSKETGFACDELPHGGGGGEQA